MTNKEKYELTVQVMKERFPNLEIKFKDEDTLQKIIGFFAGIFNKNYMKTYITVMFGTVYFPSRAWLEKGIILDSNRMTGGYKAAWKVLWHEYVHLLRAKSLGKLFTLTYILPQIAAILSLLSLFAIWFSNLWLLNLIWLVLLAPLPAYFRMKEEYYAYTMSMAINYWRYGSISEGTVSWIENEFTGWGYYKMWPFKNNIRNRLEKAIEDIKYEKVFNYPKCSEAFTDARHFMNVTSS